MDHEVGTVDIFLTQNKLVRTKYYTLNVFGFDDSVALVVESPRKEGYPVGEFPVAIWLSYSMGEKLLGDLKKAIKEYKEK